MSAPLGKPSDKKSCLVMEFFRKGGNPPPYLRKLRNRWGTFFQITYDPHMTPIWTWESYGIHMTPSYRVHIGTLQTISITDEAWSQFKLERGCWHSLPCLQTRWFSKPKLLVNVFPHFGHMLHNLVLSQMPKPSKWFATFLVIHAPHSYEAQDYIPEKYFHRTYKRKTPLIMFHSAQ